MWREGILDHVETAWYLTGNAGAGTTATAYIGPVPPGYAWYVERMSCYSASSGNPVLEVAVQTTNTIPANWDRSTREDYTPAAKNDIADQLNPIYVPENNCLVAYWTALNNNDVAILGVQIAVHLVDLASTPKQLLTQIHESHVPPHTLIPEHQPEPDRPPAVPGMPETPPPPVTDPTPDERQIAATADSFRTM